MLHGGVAGAARPGCGMAGSTYVAVVGGVGVKGSVYSGGMTCQAELVSQPLTSGLRVRGHEEH